MSDIYTKEIKCVLLFSVISLVLFISFYSFSFAIESALATPITNQSNTTNSTPFFEETMNLTPCFICMSAVGQTNFLPVSFLEEGFKVQKSVAKITNCLGQFATGFMISSSMLLTNNHEIRNEECAKKSVFGFNNQVYPNGTIGAAENYTADISFFVTSKPLDYTIVKLNGNPGIKWGYVELPHPGQTFAELFNPYIEKLVRNGIIDADYLFWIDTLQGDNLDLITDKRYIHANILQHPQGNFKQLGLQDNYLTSVDEKNGLIRYTTDTDDGSSGSPVFNDNWDLIALHHKAGEKISYDILPQYIDMNNTESVRFFSEQDLYVDNEGVLVNHIVNDLVSRFNSTSEGIKFLKEVNLIAD